MLYKHKYNRLIKPFIVCLNLFKINIFYIYIFYRVFCAVLIFFYFLFSKQFPLIVI